jgi:hypothetical protein
MEKQNNTTEVKSKDWDYRLNTLFHDLDKLRTTKDREFELLSKNENLRKTMGKYPETFYKLNLADEPLTKMHNTVDKILKYRAKYSVIGIPLHVEPRLIQFHKYNDNTQYNIVALAVSFRSPEVSVREKLSPEEAYDLDYKTFQLLTDLYEVLGDECDYNRLSILTVGTGLVKLLAKYPEWEDSSKLMRIPGMDWRDSQKFSELSSIRVKNAVNVLTKLIIDRVEKGEEYESTFTTKLLELQEYLRQETHYMLQGFESYYSISKYNGIKLDNLKTIITPNTLVEILSMKKIIDTIISETHYRKRIYDFMTIDPSSKNMEPYSSMSIEKIVSSQIYRVLAQAEVLRSNIELNYSFDNPEESEFNEASYIDSCVQVLKIIEAGRTIDESSIKVVNSDYSEIGKEKYITLTNSLGQEIQYRKAEKQVVFQFTDFFTSELLNISKSIR